MESTPLPAGFRAAGLAAGIKKNGQSDLGLLLAEEARPAAAVFTKSLLLGAHVHLCREHLAASGGRVRAVLVNSGNANCATGDAGLEDARTVAASLAGRLGCQAHEVLFLSTGVIGARLPVERITRSLDGLLEAADPRGARDFAAAIMTTDTHRKLQAFEGRAGERAFRVAGVAKGAGMIHPDMATMLGFLLTDAPAPADPAGLLRRVSARSFQRLTVDGDTSPNDTVLLWCSGASVAADVEPALERGLTEVGEELCRMIAADGEGATRLVTVFVHGAPDEEAAAHVGRVIATSPLVKTAIHGRDPNWGRILSAAARAGVPFDPARAVLRIGEAVVYELGRPLPENEPEAARALREGVEVRVDLDLGAGQGGAEVWTCDLSADYVRINAEYRS